jgi:hypothetical protein
MSTLPGALAAWGSKDFKQSLKEELETLRQDVLPLQQVVGHGNRVYDHDLGVTVMGVSDDERAIHARVGIFFAEVISCVSCGEGDPIDEAYCEMQVAIDKKTAQASFSVIED